MLESSRALKHSPSVISQLQVPALAPTPESSCETGVPSDMVGELVMEALSTPDQVAYIRFTSVYRNFREAKDLGEFLGRIASDEN